MAWAEVKAGNLLDSLHYPDYIQNGLLSAQMRIRDEALDNIPRFGTIPEMTHRPTLGAHSVKVPFFAFYIGQALLESGVEIDQPKLVYMGQHHDDAEILIGDVPTPVKRSASPEEQKSMESKELEAIKKLESSTPKPTWFESIEKLFQEYKDQETLESRIVYYLDKWDGLHEAINEVVCGDNKDAFRGVISEYGPLFKELNRENTVWQRVVTSIIGHDIFKFPDPNRLVAKNFNDLDFTNVVTLALSLSKDNAFSYNWWLFMNQAIFKTWFFKYVLPGWQGLLPEGLKEDFDLAKTKLDVIMIKDVIPDFNPDYDVQTYMRTGLFVPRTYDYELGESFADSLILADAAIRHYLSEHGQKFRDSTGAQRAKGKYYNDLNSS